jgi:hypothetical protein
MLAREEMLPPWFSIGVVGVPIIVFILVFVVVAARPRPPTCPEVQITVDGAEYRCAPLRCEPPMAEPRTPAAFIPLEL